jgi:hypothetical protein
MFAFGGNVGDGSGFVVGPAVVGTVEVSVADSTCREAAIAVDAAIAQSNGFAVIAPEDGKPFSQDGATKDGLGFELVAQGNDVPKVFKDHDGCIAAIEKPIQHLKSKIQNHNWGAIARIVTSQVTSIWQARRALELPGANTSKSSRSSPDGGGMSPSTSTRQVPQMPVRQPNRTGEFCTVSCSAKV